LKTKVYFTGSPICGECGRFLQPEVVRGRTGVPTGQLIVRGHQPNCALYGLAVTVPLPSCEVLYVAPEGKAAA